MLEILARNSIKLVPGYPAVYIDKTRDLIIADLHLGFEEEASKAGVYIPRLQLRKGIEMLRDLHEKTPARRLVIDGDLKHTFDKLTIQEREETTKFLAVAKDLFSEVILVRGNHDNYVTIVTERFDVEVLEAYRPTNEILVVHGHKEPEVHDYNIIIIGHEHPALRIEDELGAIAKIPCFLIVPLKEGAIALVLPASGYYQTGNDVTCNPENYLSPIIRGKGNVENAIPVIYGKEFGLMEFPVLKTLCKTRFSLAED